MSRRSHRTARKGQVFASEWTEWHVECAVPACDGYVLVAGLGEAFTIAQAEKKAKEEKECKGWVRRKGLWYCPAHAGLAK